MEHNWVVAGLIVNLHLYAICADGLIRPGPGIIGETRLSLACTHWLNIIHALIRVQRVVTGPREIDSALRFDPATSKSLQRSPVVLAPNQLDRRLAALWFVQLQFKPLPDTIVKDKESFQHSLF